MGDVSLRLLGGFEATVDGVIVPESAWRLKKARELVKLLALAPGHRLHREQAMDVFWRDRGPAAAANNLHQAVHVARRALDPAAIGSQNEVLSLVAKIDVDRFELAAADARLVKTTAAYRAALALYAGELLPENRYDDWAETRREELAALVVEPEQEFSAFGPTIGFGLPANTSSFVGRERELAELQSLLVQTRLLTLSGTGGTGKTRLALELARGAEPAFESGAALVELAELTDPRLIPDAVAASLDLRALPGQDLVDAVIGFLASRRVLLVLDNCEHVLAATASLVDALLRAAPQVTIVATSREPLRVPGEVVFRVPSLDIPDPEQALPPTELREYEAVSLFVERAAAASPGFALDGANADDVARICLRLDGLPLALELAAGRVGALSPAAIAERLDDRFRLLRAGSLAGPTRQQTLSATLQWSHDLLEADERILFRRLAIFAGSFELEAAEEVGATDNDLESSRIADLLARLADKSLVAVGEAGHGRRYRLLETVRIYARERLDEAGEWPVLAERHARWALALAEREHGSPRLDRDAPNLRTALSYLLQQGSGDATVLAIALLPFWLRRIDLEEARRSFAAVVEAAPEITALRAEALLAAAAIELRSGTLAEGFMLAETSYAVASEIGDKHREWRALQVLGEFGIANDSVQEAALWLERALELARSERFEAAEAIGVHSLGVAHWILGDLASAESLVAESIELFRAREGTQDTIPSPLNIAEIRMSQPGERARLRHIFEDTLHPLLEISCGAAVSYALANQAGIARVRGDLDRARALLDESTARFEAARDDAGLATVLVRRAYIALTEGELGEARSQLEQALELRLSDRRGRGLVLSGLGLVAITAGNHAGADQYLSEARDIFRRAGDRWGLASTLWRIADLAIERGRLDEAEAALQEARTVLAPTQRERWIASTIAGLAEVSSLRGDAERAVELLADARRRYAASDDAVGLADIDKGSTALLRGAKRRQRSVPYHYSSTRQGEERTDMNQTIAPVLGEATLQELREAVRGEILTASDEGYVEAARIWNGAHDCRPALVARCTGVADVIAAVGFARSNDLRIAVRGGGHSLAGFSTCDDGIVIDLSPMKGVRVDPETRRATIGGGALWADVDHESQANGLATTGGLVSSTGVGGFTLGGGIGWLMRKHGLACDNLVAADLVTADGRIVHATVAENADLLWGLRGGGGNFGIVTQFELQLHPVGPMVYAGPIFYPADTARDLLRTFRDWAADAPDEITALVDLTTAPPLPVIPEEWHGKKVAAFLAVSAGPLDNGEPLVREFRTVAEPIADLLGPMPYHAIQTLLDPLWGKRINAYFKATNLSALDDDLVDRLCELHLAAPGAQCEIHVHQMGGAVGRIGDDATAFAERSMPFVLNAVTGWHDPDAGPSHTRWAREVIEAASDASTGRAYVNFLGDTDAARASYGETTYERLVALKNEYDPTNVFRLNQNIKPETSRE